VTSTLLDFSRGRGVDAAGRTIEDIWAWDHRRLEMVHDYIQWLFPLLAPSRFNPAAPLLSAADIAAFCEDADLRARVMQSLDLMLAFYGLERRESAVGRRAGFTAAADWVEPLNHNHLRLTRIMLFLRHIDLKAQRPFRRKRSRFGVRQKTCDRLVLGAKITRAKTRRADRCGCAPVYGQPLLQTAGIFQSVSLCPARFRP